ncbi:hypothetical protein H3V53_38410 [Paraburkholderia bengalensis]|uniref:Uncharacterized protein n=1 Tax=Paraburkholderia bengalensis TaxID=2747562 RepID=A0ABU8J519_9BURK
MKQKTRPQKGRTGRTRFKVRRKAPACPPIGALMRYGQRTVRVIAEASGQRVIIESVNEDGRAFRSTVKWISLSALHDQLF